MPLSFPAWSAATLAVLALAPGPASAQQTPQTPDAGSILRDTERTTPRLTAPPAPLRPVVPEAPPTERPAQGPTIHVTAFHVTATLFPEAELQAVLAPFRDRDLTLAELQSAAGAIGAYYRQRGYLARAYLPRQEIRDGVVTIAVQESRLGRVVVDPSSETRLDAGIAAGYLLDRQAAGEALRLDALEDGVAALDALPGLAVTATAEAGQVADQTDIRLKLTEGPLFRGVAVVDNQAQRASGGWRGVAVLSANDLAGIGDQTILTGVRSLGTNYGRLAAILPVGYSGLRLGINGSAFDYRVAHDFNAGTPDGWGATGGATATLPLWRTAEAAVDGRLTYEHRRLVNRTAAVVTGISVIDAATLGVSGVARDGWNGDDQVDLALTAGDVDLGGVPENQAVDDATARTKGGYAKLAMSVSHAQPLGKGVELVARLAGQWASGNLDSSERLALGGPDAIRAYPVNEGQGAEGALGSLELRWQPVDGLRLAAFWDGGWIRQFVSPWRDWNRGTDLPNDYGLQGIGVAVNWRPVGGLMIDATLAHVVGDNAGRIAGTDSDGLRRHTRAWVRVTGSF
ncbi:ShlB/FhaC/HecB family hemolysin secretion/activation protein [Nitrospirillum sp. BR 11163]|uniref:ShlB/FhaC/HecB family hemolysin secretion/activation protein n=1 Tax=Nitrospirillum sp. BR 11163 TaxID=3104323 RepID=UPI002AFE0E1C|nr:ShlB/FhaC/HecB family hemolysin secretion/activation protein [Nitrospirillum sp. BR 11163]MEA1675168.1 ShlB/FhaC/HecB family hemolysin secretion/activation protein [Nitrospirillum sp. BR 11163]